MKVIPRRLTGARKGNIRKKEAAAAPKAPAPHHLKALTQFPKLPKLPKLPKPPQWTMPAQWFRGKQAGKPFKAIRLPVKWPLARAAKEGARKETHSPGE
ncbi:hypothetical protein [Papillibacter cinnamivorans]|uniref:Uncharacterized protein n=1 Tax=Papillibacter cinnamivorans DSM 12816 TaxID=1122930 RepID=A0A1W1Z2I9_9FIRM|nr:hypothetical protein [Papillibacter cinnamivorans]SMC42604.1 hypothetical protein SAMN02745168_0888 [Papillibacter cinnamivorans DSM 12816]